MNLKSTRWHFASFSGKFRAAPMRTSAFLVPAVLAVVMASACSSQGEGDFCDPFNGNNDCADGLVCGPAPGLPSTGLPSVNRCCPVNTSLATTAVCTLGAANVLDGSTEVPDAFALGVPDAEAGAAAETGPALDAGRDAEAGVPEATAPSPDASPAPDAAGSDGSPE